MKAMLLSQQHKRFVGLMALFMIVWGASGCYTRLSHPPHQEDMASSESSGTCTRCHAERLAESQDGSSWVDYYSYSSSPWLNYYASPWWYESEWVHCDWEYSEPTRSRWVAGEKEPAGRLAWGRRITAEGDSPHDDIDRTTSSAPQIPAPSGPASSGPSVTAPAETGSGNQAADREKEAEKQKRQSGRAVRR